MKFYSRPVIHTMLSFILLTAILIELHAATFTYSYDSLNRLTNAAYSDGSSESYVYDNAGNRLTRSTSVATIPVDTTPPSVPADLATNSFTSSQLSASWSRSTDTGGSGLAGYDVYLNGSLIATVTSTNFLLSGLMPDTEYCLSVAAFDHSGNVSAQSSQLCLTTPLFQPPYLLQSGFSNGYFQIGVTGGTPGLYDVWGSSNLIDWQKETNIWLPLSNANFLLLNLRNDSRYFYRLGLNTNVP